ncbi:MAG TPA: cupin-like domain-containing protein [Telluria sp.]|nr:cupin-like domain-containing protein [Telluria sp.]
MNRPLPALQPIPEWHDVDAAVFRNQILAHYRPAVLRGVARDWPAVRQALQSAGAAAGYIAGFDNGAKVDAIMTPPEADGRIFYAPGMDGFNYLRNQLPVSAVIGQLARYANFASAPAVAVQSALIASCLPGFAEANPMSLLDPAVQPRIWIGNRVITPAHFDQSSNLAVVAAGRRRFTLFPPEQVGNLYIGPLDYAPTPTPISMVSFKEPDFARFPKFHAALAAAQVAELGPGDAIYIPTLWWHHVESLDPLNVLVNYWWGSVPALDGRMPFDCLLDCLRTMKDLPAEQRRAWGALFQHYLFDGGDPAAHIPEHKRGVLARAAIS